MTLKDKFNDALDLDNDNYIIFECIEIADKLAIGFAEWFNNLKYDAMRYKTMEEHLEIYKKEKGL